MNVRGRMAHFASNRRLNTRRQLIPYANLVKIYVCGVIDKILDAWTPPSTSPRTKIYISFRNFSDFSSAPSVDVIHATQFR